MKPTIDTARKGTEYHIRRSTSIFHRSRHASAKLGGGSSASMAASLAPAARRSWAPSHRVLDPKAEDDEHDRRHREDEERHPPGERCGQHAGEQRTEEVAQHVRSTVEREHGRALVDRVPVGDQRVVRGIHHRSADAGAHTRDDEHPDRRGGAGHDREDRPGHRAHQRDRHPVAAVRRDRDRHLHEQRTQGGRPDQGQDAGVAHPERIADVGQQDAESGAVELIHGVETEQDQQREDGAVAHHLLERATGSTHRGRPPPHVDDALGGLAQGRPA
jgi:hypothetical protein